jgi:hypothetical protein
MFLRCYTASHSGRQCATVRRQDLRGSWRRTLFPDVQGFVRRPCADGRPPFPQRIRDRTPAGTPGLPQKRPPAEGTRALPPALVRAYTSPRATRVQLTITPGAAWVRATRRHDVARLPGPVTARTGSGNQRRRRNRARRLPSAVPAVLPGRLDQIQAARDALCLAPIRNIKLERH